MTMLLFATVGSMSAQNDDFKRGTFNHLGVNVGVGLEGVSVGVAAPVTNYLEVEAGVNIMPGFKLSGDLDIPSQTINVSKDGYSQSINTPDAEVNAEGKFSRTTFNVKAFVYPFGGDSKFFVAGGFSFGGKKIAKVTGSSDDIKNFVNQNYPEYKNQILNAISANLGGYNLQLDDNYSIDGDVRCNAFRPYLGLGFGRLVPKKRVGFRFELGCQFMGSLKVYQNDQELDLDKILQDSGNDDISKFVKDFKVYPCLKFSLVGRIL